MKTVVSKMLSTLLLSCMASTPLLAQAQLTHANTSFGANSATFDSETNLQWLNLNHTRNLSFNEVTAAQAVGGQFYGWRYATTAEWVDFYGKLGFVSTASLYVSTPSLQQRTAMDNAVLALGNLSATGDPNDRFQGGLVGDSLSAGSHRYFYWSYDACLGVNCGTNPMSSYGQFFPPNSTFQILDGQQSYGASFLVQTSPIPEPSSVLLFLAGLGYLVSLRINRTQ